MKKHLTCRHPDRDSPKLLCGYPLPCPHHTVKIHIGKNPPTVEIPITSDAIKYRERLADIASIIKQ